MSEPIKINARQAATDFRSGMTDTELMDKFKVSAKGLQSLARKLVDAGLLLRSELDARFKTPPRVAEVAWTCPACGMPGDKEAAECPNCGVIVAKFKSRLSEDLDLGGPVPAPVPAKRFARDASTSVPVGRPSPTSQSEEEFLESIEDAADEAEDALVPEPRSLGGQDWLIVAAGAALALLFFFIPFARQVLSTFVILVHEMGHCIFGWLFGYPSAPAFDVMYGGGVTLHLERSTLLAFLLYPVFAGLIYVYRKNTATVVVLLVAMLIHAVINYTKVHYMLILFMGHGTELIIAGLFIYRALSGRSIVHSAERPLYALLGFFVVFFDLNFAYRLLTNASYRAEYGMAKGGAIEMDFIQIAADYLHTGLTAVVWFFFICCLLTPLLAFLAYRYEQYIHWLIVRLWVRDPAEMETA